MRRKAVSWFLFLPHAPMLITLTSRALGNYGERVFLFNMGYIVVAIVTVCTSLAEICGYEQPCLEFVLFLASMRSAVRTGDFEGFIEYEGRKTFLYDFVGCFTLILIQNYF